MTKTIIQLEATYAALCTFWCLCVETGLPHPDMHLKWRVVPNQDFEWLFDYHTFCDIADLLEGLAV